MLNYVNVNLA